MSSLSQRDKEFVSGLGTLKLAPMDAPAAGAPAPVPARGRQEIDARGISSPLHLLRAHRALRALQPGQELKVITGSAQTIAEFQSLAKHEVGYELLSQEQIGDEVIHVLRRRR